MTVDLRVLCLMDMLAQDIATVSYRKGSPFSALAATAAEATRVAVNETIGVVLNRILPAPPTS